MLVKVFPYTTVGKRNNLTSVTLLDDLPSMTTMAMVISLLHLKATKHLFTMFWMEIFVKFAS